MAWPLAAAAQEADLDEILARAAGYIAQYEDNLPAVVADERYRQESGLDHAGGPIGLPGARGSRSLPQVRELVSEFLLLHVPGVETQWTTLRHVLKVDGRDVRDSRRRFDGDDLRRSPRETIADWKRLNEESAQYNIGPIGRTINVPTLALVVLRADYQAQFAFRVADARDRVDGFDTVVLAYEELDPPTLVSDFDGEKVYTSGRVWVTPADGRVVRTEFATRFIRSGARVDAKVTVRYGLDRQLEAWVPVQMDEQYLAGRIRIQCVARYSNYRRLDARP